MVTPDVAALWHDLGEAYGRMPHEIASGVLDVPGVRSHPRVLTFAVYCRLCSANLQRRLKEEADA